MLAIGPQDARNAAIVIVIVFLLGAVGSMWLMKTIVQKAVVALVLAALAFSVYSQRSTLQTCVDDVRGKLSRNVIDEKLADTQCSFFGIDVTISDPRDGDT